MSVHVLFSIVPFFNWLCLYNIFSWKSFFLCGHCVNVFPESMKMLLSPPNSCLPASLSHPSSKTFLMFGSLFARLRLRARSHEIPLSFVISKHATNLSLSKCLLWKKSNRGHNSITPVLMEIPGQTERKCKHLRREGAVYIVHSYMGERADLDLKQVSPGVSASDSTWTVW